MFRFKKSIEDGIAAVTDTVRTYTENVMHQLVRYVQYNLFFAFVFYSHVLYMCVLLHAHICKHTHLNACAYKESHASFLRMVYLTSLTHTRKQLRTHAIVLTHTTSREQTTSTPDPHTHTHAHCLSLSFTHTHTCVLSLNPLQEDQSEESLRDRDRYKEDHPHTTSLRPRWFRSHSAEKADLVPHDSDSDFHTIRMVANPILNSPQDVKSANRNVRWNSDLNEKTPSHTIGRNSVDGANDNSSTGGSDINADFYYDSDDHDYYGGKSVFDTNSESSDQSAHPQNHGIENVKTANQKMRDDEMQKNNDSSGMKYIISNPFKVEKNAVSHRENDQNDRKTVNFSKSDIIAQLERDGSSREVSTKNEETPLTFPLLRNKMEEIVKNKEVIESERDYYSNWEEEKYDLCDKSTVNVKYNDNV